MSPKVKRSAISITLLFQRTTTALASPHSRVIWETHLLTRLGNPAVGTFQPSAQFEDAPSGTRWVNAAALHDATSLCRETHNGLKQPERAVRDEIDILLQIHKLRQTARELRIRVTATNLPLPRLPRPRQLDIHVVSDPHGRALCLGVAGQTWTCAS